MSKNILINALIVAAILFTMAFKCRNNSYVSNESSTPRPQSSRTTTKAKTSNRTLTEADVKDAFQRHYDDLAESHSATFTPAYAEVEYTGSIRILEQDEYGEYIVKAPHIGKIISESDGKVQQTYDYIKESTNVYFYWEVDKWKYRHKN